MSDTPGNGPPLTIYTIGFTRKSAERFFGLLGDAGIERLLDARAFPNSQLSGFARGADLPFLLRRLLGASYEHRAEFAPPSELVRAYRSDALGWESYASQYVAVLAERRIEDRIARSFFERPTVLLCSEPSAERCHRRLLVEYLSQRWRGVERVDL